ncbi:MAG TPA: 30S ribosomal protein S20 [Anaerolineae bacterium]|nr:30S ribosomal protein S20 [Anaerolineae bacterium]HOQ98072.1 30S ribosomal protein S20 [Anaerolineae bacterium]HPL27414.1 30S ribosomal protein S20 [Anaerolineae bacterium]
MANTKSALKALRQAERRRVYNRMVRTRTRTFVKKARVAIVRAPAAPTTEEALRQAISALDRAVTKGVIHRNTAARRKSRLMRQLHTLRGEQAGA